MKIRILSDIHLEFSVPAYKEGAEDIVVLAGDIGKPMTIGPWARGCFPTKPIVYIPGNHEFHSRGGNLPIKRTDEMLKNELEFYNIQDLRTKPFVLGDTTFVGATLWTNFDEGRKSVMDDYAFYMNDVRCMHGWSADKAIAAHDRDLDWIALGLENAKTEKKVVVSHHLPSFGSIDPRFANAGDGNFYFASDLDIFIEDTAPDLWIHGHTHASCDYILHKTRVVCNPRGYTNHDNDSRIENPHYNSNLIIEI